MEVSSSGPGNRDCKKKSPFPRRTHDFESQQIEFVLSEALSHTVV